MAKKADKSNASGQDGFINVPVTRATREGLHKLKVSMNADSQGEVIEKMVAIILAIQEAARK